MTGFYLLRKRKKHPERKLNLQKNTGLIILNERG